MSSPDAGSGAELTDPVDRALAPWWAELRAALPPLRLLDAHMHIGSNDPDGFAQRPEELLEALAAADARGLVFPMHEPAGYRAANDAVIELAADSQGRVQCLCRVDPKGDAAGAVAEAERCLGGGARGIKLHPRAEGFTLHEPVIGSLFELAAEARAPILIHAGRGIPALGTDALRLADAHPEARIILAHAAISDLAWIWREVEAGCNIFFDTAWWNPSDLLALMALVPSSQILWASDSPYGRPLSSAVMHLRCALQAGIMPEGIESIAGAQAERILAGEETLAIGRPHGERDRFDPLPGRVYTHLISAFGCSNGGGDPSEQVDLARLACQVDIGNPHAELLGAVERLLGELARTRLPAERSEHRFAVLERYLVAAMSLVRTPLAPTPA